MPPAAVDRLVRLLADGEAQARDSASLHLPKHVLDLSIEGVGEVALPVRGPQAKKLISVARPAAVGKGEETLHDASVRDTWELTPDQVHLGGAGWAPALEDALERLGFELGIPGNARLRAEMHSLLVYGKGQFFAPHQDSEKHDDMVATLVLSLPSIHTGGELVVDDRGHLQHYPAPREDLVLVAFYADRRHEVRPVGSGHRVTITFNLILQTHDVAGQPPAVEQAAELLTEHFRTGRTSRYGDRDLGTPDHLAFLLNHEYSRKGLSADRLKGADADHVALIRGAAELAGCETALAQADLQETWEAMPSDDREDYYGYYGFDGNEQDDGEEDWEDDGDHSGGDDGEYELGELVDDSTQLTWWNDARSAGEISLSLSGADVCAITPSSELSPYASEYEGYMGNYGNTLDRWYRRAALVVWPKEKAFLTRAQADPGSAVRTLHSRIEAGDLATARQEASSLQPFWRRVPPALLSSALEVAAGLDDPGSAAIVLAPFRLEMLTADHAPALVTLARTYDGPWWDRLRDRWDTRSWSAGNSRATWVSETLVPLCHALREQGADGTARWFTEWVWEWLAGEVRRWTAQPNPVRREENLRELGPCLAALLVAAEESDGENIVEELRTHDDGVLALLVSALRHANGHQPAALQAAAQDAKERLTRVLNRPPRDPEDWSIDWTSPGGGDEDHLAAFLNSPTARTETWPLAKPRRRRIHSLIDAAGLPVSHTTRRVGSPHKLILTKTEALFAREAAARQQAEADLAWLNGQ